MQVLEKRLFVETSSARERFERDPGDTKRVLIKEKDSFEEQIKKGSQNHLLAFPYKQVSDAR